MHAYQDAHSFVCVFLRNFGLCNYFFLYLFDRFARGHDCSFEVNRGWGTRFCNENSQFFVGKKYWKFTPELFCRFSNLTLAKSNLYVWNLACKCISWAVKYMPKLNSILSKGGPILSLRNFEECVCTTAEKYNVFGWSVVCECITFLAVTCFICFEKSWQPDVYQLGVYLRYKR